MISYLTNRFWSKIISIEERFYMDKTVEELIVKAFYLKRIQERVLF
jgi:hypothetical protein